MSAVPAFELERLLRPNIVALEPYRAARHETGGGAADGTILLDANENPYAPELGPELEGANRYPDPYQLELRQRLAAINGVEPGNVFVGTGSDEVIDLLIRLLCVPGRDAVMVAEPTYGMYRVAAAVNDVRVVGVPLDADCQLDVPGMLGRLDGSVRAVFCCSPNNPTGALLARDAVAELCRAANALVVVDEAYIEFAPQGSVVADVVSGVPNLVVLRTLSKAWGLAGLRLGYAIAPEPVVRWLMRIKAPYNVGVHTARAALRALRAESRMRAQVAAITAQRERLAAELARLPFVRRVFPSHANFLLIGCNGSGAGDAASVLAALRKRGIVVRDRSAVPGLEGCLRISVGTEAQNDALLQALRDIAASESLASESPAPANAGNAGGLPAEPAAAAGGQRRVRHQRVTAETRIAVEVNLDGSGVVDAATGIGFLDHMLAQLARHSLIDIRLTALGDLHIDEHHTVEDVGITLGEAITSALGNRRGIQRYGFLLPMDEALAHAAIDLGGRPYLVFEASFARERVGDLPTELVEDFFRALANGMRAAVHISVRGRNDHHKIEAAFKGLARALRMAIERDARAGDQLPTTKGVV